MATDPADLNHAQALKIDLAVRMYGGLFKSTDASVDTQMSYLSVIPPGSNVLGFGYGIKWTGASIAAKYAIRVYVRAKLPKSKVPLNEQIPDEIDGVPTDIVAVGEITAAFPRPTSAGVSGGHFNVSGGTLGCLVSRNGVGRFILSNNHVLADHNRAGLGDQILEPGKASGGVANPPIARLTDKVDLNIDNGLPNEVDAAIAELIDPTFMTPDIEQIGAIPSTPLPAANGMSVIKHGAVTQTRQGIVEDPIADFTMVYPGVGGALFHNQFAVRSGGPERFADRGDSGSLVIEAVSHRPVGLLFGVSPPLAFCNRIGLVLSKFNATIL